VVLWAWRRWLGAALVVDAVKLAARQVGDLPLPIDGDLWDEAARLVATVGPTVAGSAVSGQPSESGAESVGPIVREVARLMTAAYGADDAVFRWWLERFHRNSAKRARSRSRLTGVGRIIGPGRPGVG
jgi:hypothetical protein